MLTVTDAMTPNPICVHLDDPVSLLAKRLLDHDIRHLPVLDAKGGIAGMVTAPRVFHLGTMTGPQTRRTWLDFTVDGAGVASDIMTPVALAATIGTPLITAIERLVNHVQDILVVVNDARHPIGVLTEHDGAKLAQAMLKPTQKVTSWKDEGVRTIRGATSAQDALEFMDEKRCRHLLVEHRGQIISVVSYFNLLRVGADSRPNLTVLDACSRRDLRTAPDGISLREAARILHVEKIGCLPLRDTDDTIVRVVTRRDVLAGLARAIKTEELFEVIPKTP